jgi:hypothetical protein
MQSSNISYVPFPFSNAPEGAAVIMATAHINYDLMMALVLEGLGTDETWAAIGNVVNNAAKQHGRYLTNLMNGLPIRPGNTGRIDPLMMRNQMRNRVRQYYQNLQNQGKIKK